MFALCTGAPRFLAPGLAALAVWMWFGTGCAHPRAPSAPLTRRPAPQPSLDQRAPILSLTQSQQRRAEALAHYATAVSLEWNRRGEEALAFYDKAFELDPTHTALAVRLAQVYASRKDLSRAVEVLQKAATAAPDSAEPVFWLGVIYKAAEQTEKAVPVLRQALKLDPMHLGAAQVLLGIYIQQDAAAEAAKLLDHAWRQKSNLHTYWVRLGDLYSIALRQKPSLAKHTDPNRVRLCYEKALQLSPDDPEIVQRLAEVYADSGDFEKAAEAYSKLLQQKPDLPNVRERLAVNFLRANRKDKAAEVLEEIIKREPSRFDVYNSLGELYEDLEQDERAISRYRESLALNPNQLPPYLRIALLQFKHKHYDAAAETLNTAREKFPTAYHVPYYFGLLHSEQKQYDKAVAAFADAETLALDSPEPVKLDATFYFYYGAACERAGNIEKAAELFRKAIELDPEKHPAYNYLGYMWADKGINLHEALDLITKAVAKDPNNGAYIDSLGWVLYKLGRHQEALTHLRRAAELVTDDAVVFEHLADVLITLGQHEEALTWLRRAHQLDPDNKAIAEKLQRLTANQSAAH